MNNCRQNHTVRQNNCPGNCQSSMQTPCRDACPGSFPANRRDCQQTRQGRYPDHRQNNCPDAGPNCCPLLDSHSTCPATSETVYDTQKSCREIPSRDCLLKEINECSFAVNDMLLYLDSHPCDEKALAYFQEHKNRRVTALKEYAKYYGPLTIDTADDEASRSFAWVETPWPWEGGDC